MKVGEEREGKGEGGGGMRGGRGRGEREGEGREGASILPCLITSLFFLTSLHIYMYLSLPPSLPPSLPFSLPPSLPLSTSSFPSPPSLPLPPLPSSLVPDTFLLVAAERSVRRIALDYVDVDYIDVILQATPGTWVANAVDYFLTADGEGYLYWSEIRAPTSTSGWT